LNFKISKRYKDILDLYVHKGEYTPFSIGTFVVFAFCFLILIVATFSQLNFSHPWIVNTPGVGLEFNMKHVAYTPQIPIMLFIIYLIGRNYSVLLFIAYLLVGFFVWPIFAFGGGLGYAQNYLFGYFLGFIVAIFLCGLILKKSLNVKFRMLAALVGVISIHITGFLYCFVLAAFKVIEFSLVFPIFSALSGRKFLYDLIFSALILLVAPYIKNVFWICMKPKADEYKKSRKSRHTRQSN